MRAYLVPVLVIFFTAFFTGNSERVEYDDEAVTCDDSDGCDDGLICCHDCEDDASESTGTCQTRNSCPVCQGRPGDNGDIGNPCKNQQDCRKGLQCCANCENEAVTGTSILTCQPQSEICYANSKSCKTY